MGPTSSSSTQPGGGALAAADAPEPSDEQQAASAEAPAVGERVDWQPVLEACVLESLEFWFSAANLKSDAFMRRQIWLHRERFVPLKVLMQFGRLRSWCQDADLLVRLARSSSVLEVRGE